MCDHYRVLPTEERFKRLTDRQKYLLFQGFIERPTDEAIHYAYWVSQRQSFTDQDELNLARRGYSPEQLLRMKRELAKAEAVQRG